MRVLVLGGTTEGRALAGELASRGVDVVSSLAGDVASPRLPAGAVRVGGFGGVEGLVAYLTDERIDAVVDATHPFARTMTEHAARACAATGVRLIRLSRPSWGSRPDASSWHWVDSLEQAREVAETLGRVVFLAIGRQELGVFRGWTDRPVVARMVDAPQPEVPATWRVIRARGPFRLADEIELMSGAGVEVLVTKDSGGSTAAKLDAAARLGVAVVIVRRPPIPAGVPEASGVAEILRLLGR